MSKNSPDQIRKEITERIATAIQSGSMPWRTPWRCHPNAGLPANFQSKRRYTGINTLILMGSALERDYHSRFWGSSSSVLSQIGAHVKKGEKATFVTFFKMLSKKNRDTGAVDKDRKGNDRMVPLLRVYPVFNIEQFQAPTVETLLDGRGTVSVVKALLGQLDRKNRTNQTTLAELKTIAKKYASKESLSKAKTREALASLINEGIQEKLRKYRADVVVADAQTDPDFESAERLLTLSGAKIKHGGNRAFYRPSSDFIQLPLKDSFESAVDYYQTAFHELAHWTCPKNRVGRTQQFEDKESGYAFEELVAEMSSCFTLLESGVPLAENMMEKSQQYIAAWLKKMKDDPKYIFAASTQASKITDYLLTFIGKKNPSYNNDRAKLDRSVDNNERSVA
jgi:antirestriction protein ArdC